MQLSGNQSLVPAVRANHQLRYFTLPKRSWRTLMNSAPGGGGGVAHTPPRMNPNTWVFKFHHTTGKFPPPNTSHHLKPPSSHRLTHLIGCLIAVVPFRKDNSPLLQTHQKWVGRANRISPLPFICPTNLWTHTYTSLSIIAVERLNQQ